MQTITNSTALASRYIIAKIAILTCITCQAECRKMVELIAIFKTT